MKILPALFAAGLIALLMPAQASAQPKRQRIVQTIDVQVFDSDSVVIGRIVTLKHKSGAVEAEIAVDETLKGTPQKTQYLRVTDALDSSEVERLFKKNKAAQLLVSGTKYTILDAERLAVPTANGGTIRERDEVIRYARQIIRDHPGVHNIQTVVVGGRIVPVDAQLEPWAIEAIESRASDVNRYYDAIRVLQFFKSDTNIARLKMLLEDPTSSLVGQNGVLMRNYYFRGPAYNVLRKWDVPVDEPVLFEEVRNSNLR